MGTVKIAVEGCCHGRLDAIYKLISKNVELLIICGDFQAVRNRPDLQALKVPPKYMELGDFPEYYLRKKVAPILTIFIGGNHESLLYMRELQYGGWVAPNIYYLGEFGSIWFRGIRITGLSGIYVQDSFEIALASKGPVYSLPYKGGALSKIYHVKPKNFIKLMLSGNSDIILSHDWPRKVWDSGNVSQLLRHKPFFKTDISTGKLGSPLAWEALKYLKPRYWFSLHLHTRFTALVKHQPKAKRTTSPRTETLVQAKNSDEIYLDMENLEDTPEINVELSGPAESPASGNTVPPTAVSELAVQTDSSAKEKQDSAFCIEDNDETYFLALDKCLPRRRFLEIMSIKCRTNHPWALSRRLFYDSRALAIQKVVENFATTLQFSGLTMNDFTDSESLENLLQELGEEIDREEQNYKEPILIPFNFEKVAPCLGETDGDLRYWPNPQTREFCNMIGLEEPDLLGK